MSTPPEMPTPDTPQVLLEHHLKALRLPTVLREYDKVARQCAEEKTDFPRYLLRLTELELLDRDRRATERRIRQARFPVVKSLDSFDFLAIPSLNKTLVLELARCQFLSRKENLLLLGNSGTGKSHIALALGLMACQRGHRVRFITAAALVSELIEAATKSACCASKSNWHPTSCLSSTNWATSRFPRPAPSFSSKCSASAMNGHPRW